MGIKQNGLLVTDVYHRRLKPRENAFTYKVYYLSFALKELQSLANRFFSLEKFNLFGFYNKDHGARKGDDLEPWIRDILKKNKVKHADGDVVLMTMPRVLGYVFNPVSFWFCLDKKKQVRAVLAEVNNTFKESHNYLVAKPDSSVITKDDWLKADKMLHVSPFMHVKGEYQFRFYYSDEKIGVWINYKTEEGEVLHTYVLGKREPFTSKALLKVFFLFPFMTLKVITLIHYQAVILWVFKGIRYVPKPKPSEEELTKWP
jgi:hypothetical protein